jgi:hypothetical protein
MMLIQMRISRNSNPEKSTAPQAFPKQIIGQAKPNRRFIVSQGGEEGDITACEIMREVCRFENLRKSAV